jgi:DNA polymerase III gamma/tau subunit
MMEDEIEYDVIDPEVGEVKTSTVDDLIKAIAGQDFNTAGDMVNDLLSTKVSNALDQEKIAIASQIFGEDEEDEDTDISDEDLESLEDDEEIDSMLDDAMEEEDEEED